MNCEDVTMRIQDYLDRALPSGEAEMLAEHLRQCPDCRAELDAYAAVERLLQDEPFRAVPRGFAGGVMARLGAASQRRASVGRECRWIGAACAAAVLLAATVGLLWPAELAAAAELPAESAASWGQFAIDLTDDVASGWSTLVESGVSWLSVATLVGAAVLFASGLAALRLLVEPRARSSAAPANQRTHYRRNWT
ncbi:MAG: zf-HC2 domain-containing protein [Phycisphaerae bacterium]|jgi:predicted anti-sigma-YlaC factor YlaD|nr:zf-HC2 domain-containing protein [Phycisphaerae bacterium]